jgi:hypothetical protein
VAPSRRRNLVRRSIGAVIVTALLGAAVAVGAGLPSRGSVAAPQAEDPTVPVRTISPVSTAAPPSLSPRPTATATASPSAEPAGIVIRARPEPDGSFLVTESITLPAAVTGVVLRPPSIRDSGSGFERLAPVAVDLEASAGEQVVAVPDGSERGEMSLRWELPAMSLRLSYRLTQVSVVSRPAKPGRTLAAIGSLLGQMPADLPVTVEVTGRTVLSLTCPQLPLTRLSCGAGIAPKLRTLRPIPFDRSLVLVQYDRPSGR